MFIRHLLAAGVIVIGLVVGLLTAVNDSWQRGLTIGVIIVGGGMLFAIVNAMAAVRRIKRNF